MPLSAGARLGPYQVLTQIGVGGMGEVYRATDTRLKRAVAIKVLPASVAQDPDRLARFNREAEVLARLNHAHIAQIHGLETSNGIQALVMELVEGPTLADRIAQGAIPAEEALAIAKQIAEALEAAHEQGIVHRDLKPANIKVCADGTVKVLDFGLAKAMEPASGIREKHAHHVSEAPTVTSPALLTSEGVILGTAAYMSPEQARGKPVDTRTDIWAFGCVLYEMLTGRRAFDGEDVTDTLGNVLKMEPDWTPLAAKAPASVILAIRACLKKDPRQRVAHIRDALFALNGAFETAPADETIANLRAQSVWRRTLSLVAMLTIGGALVGAIAWLTPQPQPQRPLVQFEVSAPQGSLFPGANAVPRFAVSHDGQAVVFEAGPPNGPFQLWLRRLDAVDPRPLSATENPADAAVQSPFWFPGGREIGFFDEVTEKLKKVDIDGRVVQTVADVPGNQYGGSANSSGVILVASLATKGVQRISADSGETPVQVTMLDSGLEERAHLWPRFLPDGRSFLYLSMTEDRQNRAVYVASLDSGQRKAILRNEFMAEFVPPDQLLFVRGDALFSQTFDLQRLEVTGEPVVVAQPVVGTSAGRAGFSASENGVLVHTRSPQDSFSRTLVWADRQGREEPVRLESRQYTYPRLSPDGTRAAVRMLDGRDDGIWVLDLERTTFTRLTLGQRQRTPQGLIWGGDRQLVLSFNTAGARNLFALAADGSGSVAQLTSVDSRFLDPTGGTPDGTRVILNDRPGNDLSMLVLKPTPRVEPLLDTPSWERNGDVSPDGRWLAYESDSSGRFEVYVRPFPGVRDGQFQLSTDGGVQAHWSRDGRELFYFSPKGELMAVPVVIGTEWSAGRPMKVLEATYFTGASFVSGRHYDVTADGRRFLMIKTGSVEQASSQSLVVVQNWSSTLTRLLPTNRGSSDP